MHILAAAIKRRLAAGSAPGVSIDQRLWSGENKTAGTRAASREGDEEADEEADEEDGGDAGLRRRRMRMRSRGTSSGGSVFVATVLVFRELIWVAG